MPRRANDCGVRNSFGYYDARAKEIILRHPCLKKKDIEEAYLWIDEASDLRKLSIGIGTLDNCVADEYDETLFGTARGIIKQNVIQTSEIDNQIVKNILQRLKNKVFIRNLGVKCFILSEDRELFDLLLQTIVSMKNLAFLDLSGCYFTDEQLLDLAEVIAKTHIAHLVWPEPRMSELVIKKVADIWKDNRSLVVMRGVPLDLQKIAHDNRVYLFGYGRRPTMIGEKEIAIIKEYASSYRLGIAYEKQRLFDLEKAVEAVLA